MKIGIISSSKYYILIDLKQLKMNVSSEFTDILSQLSQHAKTQPEKSVWNFVNDKLSVVDSYTFQQLDNASSFLAEKLLGYVYNLILNKYKKNNVFIMIMSTQVSQAERRKCYL